jgi:hypothetical protein
MDALEFTTELRADNVLVVPSDIAARLPKSGRARVIVLIADDSEDSDWHRAAYEQFLKDDAPEDADYDTCP